MTKVLYATDTLTHKQLTTTLRKFKRHAKLGFYIEAEETDLKEPVYPHKTLWRVKLFGPKLYWKRKDAWELKFAD